MALLCNDSNFCVGGKNAKVLKKNSKFLSIKNSEFDFICLNCAMKGKHFNLFLMLIKGNYKNNNFKHFWKTYIPLNNRYYTLKWREKILSIDFESFQIKIIFSSNQLCLKMGENFKLFSIYYLFIT